MLFMNALGLIKWDGQDEFEMNLRLIGAPTIKDVTREMVDASNISTHLVAVPEDRLYHQNCASSPSHTSRGLFVLIAYVADEGMTGARLRELKARM